jgi:hypothetical protein
MKLIRSAFAAFFLLAALVSSRPALAQAAGGETILHAPEAARLLPDSVFYRGKSAGTQLRNSAGIHFPDGMYTLAVLVDTSGYSTAVQERYQAYLLTEVGLEIGGHSLAPGAYGMGFTGGRFHVMDIGDHELLTADATRDEQMPRPTPLQLLGGVSDQGYRLCFGRECINFRRSH